VADREPQVGLAQPLNPSALEVLGLESIEATAPAWGTGKAMSARRDDKAKSQHVNRWALNVSKLSKSGANQERSGHNSSSIGTNLTIKKRCR